MKKRLLFIFGMLSSWIIVQAQLPCALNGTYTINSSQAGSGTNFISFGDAIHKLDSCGVSGSVTFNVAAGTYNEQVLIESIAGVSATNTILFQADPSNTSDVVLNYAASGASDNYVWKFNGASFCSLSGMTLAAGDSSYSRVIEFSGHSSYLTVENNILNAFPNIGYLSDNGSVIFNNSSSPNKLTHSTIKNNEVNGGSYGIQMQGPGILDFETGNTIEGNTIHNFYYYGIDSRYQDSISIIDNDIFSNSPSILLNGMELYTNDNLRLTGNRIVLYGSNNIIHAVQIRACDGSSASSQLVANNMISIIDPTYSAEGINLDGNKWLNLVHNSVLINSAKTGTDPTLYIEGASTEKINIYNNNLANTGGGLAIKIDEDAIPGIGNMDHNNYFSSSEIFGEWIDMSAGNTFEWEKLSGMDSNSISSNPLYTSDENLHSNAHLLNNNGISLPYITTDFDEEARSSSAPDIGADEFPAFSGNCNPLVDLNIDSITGSSARLNWTPGNSNTSFYIEYGISGFTPGSGTSINGIYPTSQPPVYITGLTADTLYDFYVTEICNSGNDSSFLQSPFTIKTTNICPSIGPKIYLDHVTYDSAVFSFTTPIGSSVYKYEYGPAGFEQGTGTLGFFGNPGAIDSLASLTTYDIYIQTDCSSSGNDFSSWFGPFTFTTECAPEDLLSGTYTIDSSSVTAGRNFSSFADFSWRINTCGISGPVVVNVAGGTYPGDQLYLNTVSGSGSSNSIRIQADPSNSKEVKLHYAAAGEDDNYVVKIENTSYVTIENLNIESRSNGEFGRVIFLHGSGGHIKIKGNTLSGRSSTSSGNEDAVISSSSESSYHFVTIDSNFIYKGSKSIVLQSSEDEHGYASNISNNIIHDMYYNGIHTIRQDSIRIHNNDIRPSSTSAYILPAGISMSTGDHCRVTSNKIDLTSVPGGGYGVLGMEIVNYSSSTTPSLVANNMISFKGYSFLGGGVSLSSSSKMDFVYNSIYNTQNTLNCLVINGDSLASMRILNNNIVSNGGNLLDIKANVTPGIIEMDHNNLYTSGSIGLWGSSSAANLTDWISTSSMDSNSVSVNPLFIAGNDLHVQSPLINNAALPLPEVTTDIDGEMRSTSSPDIGADEFTPPPCFASQNIHATAIYSDSISIHWEAGSGETFFVEYGISGFSPGNGIDTLELTDTSYTISGLSPNTSYDIYIRDYCGIADTSIWTGPYTVRTPCRSTELLSGMYTIDSSQATGGTNYASFGEAVTDLNLCGISGPVVFNIKEGTYDESFTLNEIYGSSHVNTITFRADASNTGDVILQDSSASSSQNFVVRFNGTDYTGIEGIIIQNTSQGYGRVIVFSGHCEYISIKENILNGLLNPRSNSTDFAVIMNSDANTDHILHSTLKNNEINGGSYAIYWEGTTLSSDGIERGNSIDSNIIRNFYYSGIDIDYQDSISLIGNDLISLNINTTVYGINIQYTDNFEATGNKVVVKASISNNGFRLLSCDGTASSPSILANNMVSILSNTGNNSYGLAVEASSYVDVVYNSVLVNTAGRGIYINAYSSDDDIRLRNNNFVNMGGGHAIEVADGAKAVIIESDHNNYFTTGAELGSWGSSLPADISSWKILTNLDTHSISVDPYFLSADDLHIQSTLLDGIADPYPGVSTDIDGDPRSATPDIGADEFEPLDYNILAREIIAPLEEQCGDSNTVVSLIVQNIGVEEVTGFEVKADISGVVTTNISSIYSQTLGKMAIDTIAIPSFNSASGGAIDIKAYTDLSNEEDRSNDTVAVSINITPSTTPVPTTASLSFCEGDTRILYFPLQTTDDFLWLSTSGDTISDSDSLTVGPLGTSDTTFILHPLSGCYLGNGVLNLETVPRPEASFSFTGQSVTPTEQSFDFDAGTSVGIDSYAWDFGDGNSGSGSNTSHSYTSNGSYDVELIVTGECSSDTLVQTIVVSGIELEENILSKSLKVYPNPTTGSISVEFETRDSEDMQLRITDLSGRIILEKTISHANGTFNKRIHLDSFAKGTYLVHIRSVANVSGSGGMQAVRQVVKY